MCRTARATFQLGAVAGVECSPQVKGVDRIGVYRFADQDDLLETYFTRLAENWGQAAVGIMPRARGRGRLRARR